MDIFGLFLNNWLIIWLVVKIEENDFFFNIVKDRVGEFVKKIYKKWLKGEYL